MPAYEYRVICPPRRAKRVKGVREQNEKFAHTLTDMINAVAADGWEYMRADTLPMEEKKSMMGATTEVFQTVLVFRRLLRDTAQETSPRLAGTRPAPLRIEPTGGTPPPPTLGPARS